MSDICTFFTQLDIPHTPRLKILDFGSGLGVTANHYAAWQKALSLLDENANDKSNYLGTQYIYSNDYIAALANKYNGKIKDVYGMRAFYALGQDNMVKYTDEWYENMLRLENRTATIDEYKEAAFFNHLLIEKMEG